LKKKSVGGKEKKLFKLKSFFGKAFFSKERLEKKFTMIEHEVEAIKAKIGMI